MSAPTDRTSTLRGLTFHYLDWGRAGSPPMLLLHGAAQTAHSFDEVAPDLCRDHHVISLDQRGHGDSSWAPQGAYDREEFVADLVALLDDCGFASAVVVAMSLGGVNAMALTIAHPARVRGLVIVDVAPTVERKGVEQIHRQIAARDFISFQDAVDKARAFNPRRSLENIESRLRHSLRELPDGRWTYKFDPEISSGRAEANIDALWPKLAAIRCPTLLLRGSESPILARETADRFAREVPGAETAEVAGAGHSVMGDNPAGFLAAVRPFLARHGL